MMGRAEHLLEGLDIGSKHGAEIGPLSSPIVSRERGRVLYIDHVDTAKLKEKYEDDRLIDVSQIANVDVVWPGGPLLDVWGNRTKVDYIIASHVIEHVPDLIRWLRSLHSVLKEGGELRLAVPDKRFTFDYLREKSMLPDILSAYVERAQIPSARSILDFCLNKVPAPDVGEAWRGCLPKEHAREFTDEGALHLARDAWENRAYHDVHCWAFTPSSFAEICAQLVSLGLIDFECDAFCDTPTNELEFFVRMRASVDRSRMLSSWQRMALAADATLGDPPAPLWSLSFWERKKKATRFTHWQMMA